MFFLNHTQKYKHLPMEIYRDSMSSLIYKLPHPLCFSTLSSILFLSAETSKKVWNMSTISFDWQVYLFIGYAILFNCMIFRRKWRERLWKRTLSLIFNVYGDLQGICNHFFLLMGLYHYQSCRIKASYKTNMFIFLIDKRTLESGLITWCIYLHLLSML